MSFEDLHKDKVSAFYSANLFEAVEEYISEKVRNIILNL
jgi:hypothetical protein